MGRLTEMASIGPLLGSRIGAAYAFWCSIREAALITCSGLVADVCAVGRECGSHRARRQCTPSVYAVRSSSLEPVQHGGSVGSTHDEARTTHERQAIFSAA